MFTVFKLKKKLKYIFKLRFLNNGLLTNVLFKMLKFQKKNIYL